MLRSLLPRLRKHLFGDRIRSYPATPRPRSPRLYLECLEDRTTPSTLWVDSASDPATLTAGTLRYELTVANEDAAKGISDTIKFNVADMGTNVITLKQGEMMLSGAGPGAASGLETIDGISATSPSGIAINANYGSRIFQVTSSGRASLSGLTLENGNLFGQGDGGGIFNSGNLTLTNCDLYYDWAFDGGAIYNSGNLTLNGGYLEDNDAYSSVGGAGGAICNAGTLHVNNGFIGANVAYWDGGGIYNDADSHAYVNHSTISGGPSINGNYATYGGGIFNNGYLSVTGSYIGGGDGPTNVGNSATYGGGLYNQGIAYLSASDVLANTATADGGGIGNTATLNVSNNSVISYNKATGSGNYGIAGGIFNESTGVVTVDHSWVEYNHADNNDGGGIWNTGTLWLQDYAVIYGNSAYAGGGIDNGGTVNVYGYQYGYFGGASEPVYIEANHAAWNGGGINNGGTVTIYNAVLESNTAGTAGGGIMNDSSGYLHVYYTDFYYDSAGLIGGGIDNGGGAVWWSSLGFYDNSAWFAPNFYFDSEYYF